jgi:hypothetical protein
MNTLIRKEYRLTLMSPFPELNKSSLHRQPGIKRFLNVGNQTGGKLIAREAMRSNL